MKNITAASDLMYGSSYYLQYRYAALFGRINYLYDGKYILNITARRDGSSRFGPGRQFANFGAVGAAWIFSKERFISRTMPFLSFGKLRGSFGITGNDQISDYQYLDAYKPSTGAYQNVVGLTPARLANPNFSWEQNSKLEGAIELGFVNSRINMSVSLYRNESSSQLVGYPIPPTTGFASIQANFPATVRNSGAEFELTTTNIEAKAFTWTSAVNVSIPHNKLVSFPGIENTSYADQYVVGEPLSVRKLYRYVGVDQTVGLYQFADVNDDGNIDYLDQQSVQFVGQRWYGGFQNRLSYRGFELDFIFQFVNQSARNEYYVMGSPGSMQNQRPEVLGRWRLEGDQSSIQRYGQSYETDGTYSQLQESDHSIGGASYMRLKNISFSYALPVKWTSALRIKQLETFVHAQNLFTVTSFKGLDPETPGLLLPPLRVVTLGISVSF
ncbi:MAG: hypothetical protein QM762_26220 [Chryseolinea sp.]